MLCPEGGKRLGESVLRALTNFPESTRVQKSSTALASDSDSPKANSDELTISVWIDGACSRNGLDDARAAVGVWFGEDDTRNLARLIPEPSSNQRAELLAAIFAAERVIETSSPHTKLILYSDSSYLAHCWYVGIPAWRKHEWKTRSGKVISNQDLMAKLLSTLEKFRVVEIRPVRAHAGIRGNEEADRLAKEAIKNAPLSIKPDENSEVKNEDSAELAIARAIDKDSKSLFWLPFSVGSVASCGMFDSGASRSFVDLPTWNLLFPEAKASRKSNLKIKVANGENLDTTEKMLAPVTIANRKRDFEFHLVENMAIPCVLGLDFIRKFQLNVDFENAYWFFSGHPSNRFPFVSQGKDANSEVVAGLVEISADEKEELTRLLNEEIPPPPTKLTRTPFVTHDIDVGGPRL